MSGRVLEGTIIDRELKLEKHSITEGVAKYRRLAQQTIDRGQGACLKPVERLMLHWFEDFKNAIAHEKRQCTMGKPGRGRTVYGPPLMLLPSSKLAVMTMHELLSNCLVEPQKWTSMSISVGHAVNAEVLLGPMRRDKNEAWIRMTRSFKNWQNPRVINKFAEAYEPGSRWPIRIRAHLGSMLMWLLLGVASAKDCTDEITPAFKRYDKWRKGRRTKMIGLTTAAADMILEGHAIRQYLRPRYLPMIVRPIEWNESQRGGYYRMHKGLMISPTQRQAELMEQSDLTTIHAGVNHLSSAAWRVNNEVLSVVKQMWESGGEMPGVPRKLNLSIPPRPDDYKTNEEGYKLWKREAAQTHSQNAALKSQRVGFEQKISVADRFSDEPAIYFPHAMDFRGRAYPIPLHLNHQSDDLARGLLAFSEEKPLTDRGLYWLKIHTANMYGIDKVSFAERINWFEEHLSDIVRSGEDPFKTTPFWFTEDGKPWQFLACCINWHKIIKLGCAVSNIPVQRDGTCNGLQHYSAMTRDPEGANSTNLVPGDQPRDIYTIIADQLSDLAERDAMKGNDAAMTLCGLINRNLVKQPVMTSVYGVTRAGARAQIQAKLKKQTDIPPEKLWFASHYLGTQALNATGRVCQGARSMMNWLSGCARLIAKSNQTVVWTTPCGLTCEQHYRKTRKHEINTVAHRMLVNIMHNDSDVSLRKHVNGFPPNFIHGVDASHMMMAASRMAVLNLPFAVVHDSFWSYPSDADTTNKVLRETFVELHESDIPGKLYNDLTARYPELEFQAPPTRSTYNINECINSPYAFS